MYTKILSYGVIFLCLATSLCLAKSNPKKGYVQGFVVYQGVDKAVEAPFVTIQLKRRGKIIMIHAEDSGFYEARLEKGSYLIWGVYGMDGTELELLDEQERCIEVGKSEHFDIMIKPRTSAGVVNRKNEKRLDCEVSDYGYIQGVASFVDVGRSMRAPSIRIKLKRGNESSYIYTGETGGFYEMLIPGKYKIVSVYDADNKVLNFAKDQIKEIVVVKGESYHFGFSIEWPSGKVE